VQPFGHTDAITNFQKAINYYERNKVDANRAAVLNRKGLALDHLGTFDTGLLRYMQKSENGYMNKFLKAFIKVP
jgi:hypothetical protein